MELASQGIAMNKDKPELTWDRICQQIGKKRFGPTPRTRHGRLLKSSRPEKMQNRGLTNESNTWLRRENWLRPLDGLSEGKRIGRCDHKYQFDGEWRTKDCHVCNDPGGVLYRCRYDELEDWVFLCGECLTNVKSRFEDTYQYGGTWKSKKK